MVENLEKYLVDNKVHYELIKHEEPIISIQDAVKCFDIKKAAPTLILQTENGLVACILSSGHGRIDLKSLKQDLRLEQIELAQKDVILKETGYHIGAIPLIGHMLPCIFDRKLLAFDYICGGTGDELFTIKISPSDVMRLNNIIAFLD